MDTKPASVTDALGLGAFFDGGSVPPASEPPPGEPSLNPPAEEEAETALTEVGQSLVGAVLAERVSQARKNLPASRSRTEKDTEEIEALLSQAFTRNAEAAPVQDNLTSPASPTNYATTSTITNTERHGKHAPFHLSPEELAERSPGEIYQHYQHLIPWLQPVPILDAEGERTDMDPIACRAPWKPISTKWSPWETEALWLLWGKMLPLFADPTVEEIWVQKIPNHPTNPTPAGFLDVLSDGALGVRIHPCLRFRENALLSGFIKILAANDSILYRHDQPTGLATIMSPLELDGSRLTGGVPPASIGPFAAIRIPARVKPSLTVMVGAKKFGASVRDDQIAPGEPLMVPQEDHLAEARKALQQAKTLFNVMVSIEALDYLYCTYLTGKNVVYSGATSAAKTTVLNAACTIMPPHWRIASVETGVAELNLPHLNWVPLFANEAIDGLKQDDMIRLAMRMSPKPIPCGEIRGKEGALWVELCQTGHESSPTTLHAGDPVEALMRLTNMVVQGQEGTSESMALKKAVRAANVIVQLRREEVLIDGVIKSLRRCVSITEVHVGGDLTSEVQVDLVPMFETTVGEDGTPTLVYVGKDKNSIVWAEMRAKFLEDKIPAWAGEEPRKSRDLFPSGHKPPHEDPAT